nr:transmembrane protein 186 [Onthophagus taurus]
MLRLLTKLDKNIRIVSNFNNISSLKIKESNSNQPEISNKRNNENEDFTTIYKFPHITALSTLNKLKIYHTFVTVLGIPGSIILNQANLIQSDAIYITSAIGISGCLVLYSLSYLSKDFIGFLYVSKDFNQIKVSSIDYWGKRKDEIVDAQDIVPLSDLKFSVTDGMYFRLMRYSIPKKYWKINTRYGVVLDKKKFEKFIQ